MIRLNIFKILSLGLTALFLYSTLFSWTMVSSFNPDFKEKILSLIENSQEVSLCALSLTDPDVISVLKDKSYRLILEYRTNLPAKVGTGKYLIHAKFVVLDSYVIFGSMNFTESSLESDLNDAIIFDEPYVKEVFEEIFTTIWNHETPLSVYRTPIGDFYISPFYDLERVFMKVLNETKKSVKIAVYAFTDRNILSALKYLTSKGVKVFMIVDEWSENYIDLPQEQFKVKIYRDRRLHHKFMIVDDRILITGSANLTESAFRKNFEIIFLTRDNGIVDKYVELFEKLWR